MKDREQLLSKAIEIFEGLPASDKQVDGPLTAIKKAASELHVSLPDDVANLRTARKSQLVRELKYRIMAENPEHPDDLAVDAFAEAMKAKMRRSREEKGRDGWQMASSAHLTYLLMEHLEKGDPVDVANFAMMLHQNEQNIDEIVVQAYRKSIAS
ncbi:hypothetical protein [Acidithiobacillus ferriphilus]|uniref:hypothetical protein n=1 Tax=Acidithiobacillus ferriphilus TaxID=1689834 RepID=UPI001C0740D0|nr:hypothetical protein [Acidithiobacillus ferriphilus]